MIEPKTWVEINREALRSNIVALRSLLVPGTQMAGVVKANAYGHGICQVVPVMLENSIEVFCVDSVDEGILVRDLAPRATIIVLGYTLLSRLEDVLRYKLDQVVYHERMVQKLSTLAKKRNQEARIHLKIETGTQRQGISIEELPRFLYEMRCHTNINFVGLSTHYANIEESDDASFTEKQIARFLEAHTCVREAGYEPELIHTACSAAVILYPQTHGTLVRPGISLYGFWPSRETRNTARLLQRQVELTPVLSWKTRIAQIKQVPVSSPVGYGCTEILRRSTKIAVLPVGYYDGYDRGLSSIGEVIIRGQLCRVLGLVCMNMCMVDVTELPKVEQEDEVILIGKKGKNRMRADDVAQKLNTIHYEVTTRIREGIPRIVV